jgi:hypothetical protein
MRREAIEWGTREMERRRGFGNKIKWPSNKGGGIDGLGGRELQ